MKRRKETLEEYNDRRDAEARARQEEIKEKLSLEEIKEQPSLDEAYASMMSQYESHRPKPRLPGAQGRAAKGKT